MNILKRACRKEPRTCRLTTISRRQARTACGRGAGSPGNLAAHPVQNPQARLSGLAHDRVDTPGMLSSMPSGTFGPPMFRLGLSSKATMRASAARWQRWRSGSSCSTKHIGRATRGAKAGAKPRGEAARPNNLLGFLRAVARNASDVILGTATPIQLDLRVRGPLRLRPSRRHGLHSTDIVERLPRRLADPKPGWTGPAHPEPRPRRRHRIGRGRWKNNRAENSHQPTRRRERKMQRFKSAGSAQKFLSTHAAAYNTFNVRHHLTSAKSHRVLRAAAMTTWREAVSAA